ncbi:MAG: hypothetical protein Q7R83_00330 [bacterium]|nr:hypothetical protein [bacterium]
MIRSIVVRLLVRQVFLASVFLLVVLTVAERLVPGSVLNYFNFFWLAPVALVFAVLSLLSCHSCESRNPSGPIDSCFRRNDR